MKGGIIMQEKNNLIKCKICGKIFERTNNNQKYCSSECYKESNRRNSRNRYQKRVPKYELNCPICHNFFLPKSYSEKYCSDDCKKKAAKLQGRRHYLMKVMDAEYSFDVYTVRFDRYDETTTILKDGEVIVCDPRDLFNAWSSLLGKYNAAGEKELWKSIRRSEDFKRLQDHILKMKYVLLPELKHIKKILRL